MVIGGLLLFFLELIGTDHGQRMRKSAIRCWQDVHPALFGIGVACLMESLMLCLYHVVVIAWCCYYFFVSFTSMLPWEHDKLCPDFLKYKQLGDAVSQCASNSSCSNTTYHALLKSQYDIIRDCCVRDHDALQISPSIEDAGIGMNEKLAGCVVFAWAYLVLCAVRGIKSSGKVQFVN